ncbi:uncharacterized protein LOC134809697 isoform X2 [Pan troglodytes]|uniref:uncharacterized protein LOC134809697 isoform X2 n=1 Tax=Pan troglodytes TaxID=9598 RepID=UPI0030136BC3
MQPTGETVKPVWGLMNKCYTVPTQVMTPRRPGGLNAAVPKEEAAVLSQEGEQENKKVQKEVAAYPSGKTTDPACCRGLLPPCFSVTARVTDTPALSHLPDLGRGGKQPRSQVP